MPSESTTIEGLLEQITFYNSESHFLIARLRARNSKGIVKVLGYMPAPNPGEYLQMTGTWQLHPRYGQQFHFESVQVIMPTSVAEIEAYLRSGIIRGIGPKTVERIVARFKDKTIDIIEKDPFKLADINGIGTKTAERIAAEWKRHHTLRNLMNFLKEHGIKPIHAAKLIRLYGDNAEETLRNNPFRVASDLPGSGFYIADRIIQSSDIEVDPEERIKACLRHLLDQAVNRGDCFELERRLLEKAEHQFQIDGDSARAALLTLAQEDEIEIDTDSDQNQESIIYPEDLHRFEVAIAQRLCAALSMPKAILNLDPEIIEATVLNRLAIRLSHQQQQVLMGVLSEKVAVITGGPGTGKTTLIQAITAVFESIGHRSLLAAPTGRAARRVSEITQRDAVTLHRLLGCSIQDGYFEKDQDDQLEADAIIVDEASMVDMPLFYHLLMAVPLPSMLILVGDVSQLPSVGPGNVLGDLIRSERIPTYHLTEIFRQARESSIVLNAHRIRNGQMPEHSHFWSEEEGASDFHFIEKNHPEKVVSTIVDLCVTTIPQQFELDPISQIQVLTPMHKGVAGTLNLNQILQKKLNPNGTDIASTGGTFRVGDKVMHLRNNYHKEVFNGDIGIVGGIDAEAGEILVDYDGRQIRYDQTELDELSLAYAISIHKSQGSEYPVVIVPLLNQHYILLQRNLLYTAVTRGKKLVILVGTTKALKIALNTDKPNHRLSGLAVRITCHIG